MGADESTAVYWQNQLNNLPFMKQGVGSRFPIQSYSYDQDGVFEGLRQRFGKEDLVQSGIVNLSVTSTAWKDPTHLIEKEWSSYWYSKDEENTSLTIEFLCCKLLMSAYTLKTYKGLSDGGHLQSWVLEASNDGVEWEILDEHRRDDCLNDKYREVKFPVVPTQPYTIYKLTQTERNTFRKARYNMILRGIEFFGTLTDFTQSPDVIPATQPADIQMEVP